MRRTAKFGAAAGLAAVLAGTVAVSLFAGRTNDSLIGRANVVVPGAVRTPLPGGGYSAAGSSLAFNLETGGYAWRDDKTLLLWDDVPAGTGWRLVETKAGTGIARPIAAFNRRLEHVGGKRVLSSEWRLSPDGRWVVWPNEQDDKTGWSHRVSWTLAALDGSQARVLRAGGPPPGTPDMSIFASWAWRGDSNGWTVLTSELPRLSARSFGVTASGAFPDVLVGSATGNLPAPHPRDLLGFTPGGDAVGVISSEFFTTLFVFPIQASAAVRRREVTLPPGARADAFALSPKGDRIAWALYREEAPLTPIERLLFWVRWPARLRPQAGLFVCRLDGTGGRTLGWQNVPAARKKNEPPDSATGLTLLRWTPDGKRLSFLHQGTLYLTPADR